ncbi:unnamed protein product [Blepharisma stoltei]|uniref:Uncharacterized protein n=1 Tax=Blepharisma stoltei TaxID=1481888 RepID=A0AAU9JLF8_9CILI|nr:unnamed protein product [Blepharisma stoltei]
MGCGASSTRTTPGFQAVIVKKKYSIKVYRTLNDEPLDFSVTSEFDEIPLPTLMNIISFDKDTGDSIDANFMSIYDKENDKFDYVVQRLLGIEVENLKDPMSGNMWVPYVKGNKLDWNKICNDEFKVKPEDEIVWRFQKFNEEAENQVTSQG